MRNAERIEVSHQRLNVLKQLNTTKIFGPGDNRPVPIEICKIKLRKLTKEEKSNASKKANDFFASRKYILQRTAKKANVTERT